MGDYIGSSGQKKSLLLLTPMVEAKERGNRKNNTGAWALGESYPWASRSPSGPGNNVFPTEIGQIVFSDKPSGPSRSMNHILSWWWHWIIFSRRVTGDSVRSSNIPYCVGFSAWCWWWSLGGGMSRRKFLFWRLVKITLFQIPMLHNKT